MSTFTRSFRYGESLVALQSAMQIAIFALLGLLYLVALFLLVRALTGAFARPLDGGSLLIAGLLALGLSAAIRGFYVSQVRSSVVGTAKESLLEKTFLWGPTPALFCMALALSLPGPHWGPLGLLWLALLLHEAGWISQGRRYTGRRTTENVAGRVSQTASAAVEQKQLPRAEFSIRASSVSMTRAEVNFCSPSLVSIPQQLPVLSAEENLLASGGNLPWQLPQPEKGLLQSITRYRDETTDSEVVQGVLQAELEAGERQADLYVGFCPPLPWTPQVEVEQMDGPELRLKVGPVYPHGARIEARLSALPAERVTIAVEFVAHRTEVPEANER